MKADLDSRIQALDRATLTPLVRQALDADAAEIIDWGTRRIYGGSFGVVYRFAGEARVKRETSAWSLILKVVHLGPDDPIDRSDPSNTRYWKREPLAYQTGFLAELPGDLVAPRCFGVGEPSEREFWLWLEDVAVEEDSRWSMERYGLVARHLGQFNGAFLAGRPLPSGAWLGRGLLRANLPEVRPNIEQLPAALDHPLARRFFPDDVAAGILRLWDARERFLDVVERLPQTVCHRDAFRRNLFSQSGADGVERTVAIDWEDVAVGPVGEDLVSLVILSLAIFEVELTAADPFEALVFERYLQGLRDSGWRGDPRVVRLGYTAASVRYGLGLVMLQHLALDETRHARQEEMAGRSMPEIADNWAGVLRFVLSRTDEARRSMDVRKSKIGP